MTNYSDFIVFADESGDHGLERIDPEFPVFALAFCVVGVEDYIGSVVPDMQKLKFSTWGHDSVVLHEHDIRKSEKGFATFRTDAARRSAFVAGLSGVMERARMRVIASVIDKRRLAKQRIRPVNPYEIALSFCMEGLLATLIEDDQSGKLIHVIFESRGKREDRELKSEFERICANQAAWNQSGADFTQMNFEPVFVKKSVNSIGLQLADLVARPIALSVLRPNQSNRAYDIVSPKVTFLKRFP